MTGRGVYLAKETPMPATLIPRLSAVYLIITTGLCLAALVSASAL